MEKENTNREKIFDANERFIIIATLIIFAVTFIITAFKAPKKFNEIVSYDAGSSVTAEVNNVTPNTASHNEASQPELQTNSDLDTAMYQSSEIETHISGQVQISSDTYISAKININTASATELQLLNGIGEVKSNAIIAYRNTNGPFNSIEEILNVSGIGEKTFEKIKDYITV